MEDPFKITGTRERLEPLVEQLGYKWGHYSSKRQDILKALAAEKLLIWPNTRNYRRLKDKQLKVVADLSGKKEGQLFVVPYESGIVPQDGAWKVMKKYPLLTVRFDNKHIMMEILKERLKKVSIDDILVGYDWKAAAGEDRRFVVTTLIDCIKGFMLNEMIADDSVKVRPYCDPNRVPGQGGFIDVSGVPSLSGEEPYGMRLEGVFLYSPGKIKNPERTFDFISSHECDKDRYYPIKYGRKIFLFGDKTMPAWRKGKEKLECFHSVLAVKKARKVVGMMYKMEMYDPFIEPKSTGTTKIFKATRDCIFYEDFEGYLRPLNEVLSEILLWKYIGYRNFTRKQ